jgi:hypothetical protein
LLDDVPSHSQASSIPREMVSKIYEDKIVCNVGLGELSQSYGRLYTAKLLPLELWEEHRILDTSTNMYLSNRSYQHSGKVKDKVPALNYAPRQEDELGEWRYSSTHFLAQALDGGEWSASCPCRFTPRERAPGTHQI